MRKMKMVMTMIALVCTLSACGQREDSGNARMDAEGSTKEIYEENQQAVSNETEADSSEGQPNDYDADAEREHSAGEYDYLSDYGNGKLVIEKTSYEYEGEYSSYDVNEPALEIKKNDDGIYQIQIDLFRLYSLDDGIGKETEEGLEFSATGPGGNEVNGVIKLEEDIAVVTIFGQEWLDFAGLSEYRFYKTSDVPNMQEGEDAGLEASADELLDSFINGSISAVDAEDSASTFSISDLNMDSEDWDAYSIGEKVDLDNDGENELIISGPYGGIYLDARNNKVFEFAAGEGNALILSYTCYNGAIWIMYSNRASAGYEVYHMEKFEGADNLAAEMNFGEELADPNNAEGEMKYTLNGTEISYDEYTALCSKIFAAEVNTN